MLKMLTPAMTVLTLVTAACSGSGSESTTSTAVADSPSTSAPQDPVSSAPDATDAQPVPAASPPPASFAEIEAAYAAAVEPILAEGRAIADQLLAGDYDDVYARFDAALTAEVTADDLLVQRDELEAQAPLGPLGEERGVQLSPALRGYGIEVEWADDGLTLNASFNELGEISSLFLNPQLRLGPDPAGDYESDVSFRLPFDGLWFTFWGGDTEIENYHVVAPSQRHAFDFLVWKDGGTYAGEGSALTDYWAYGQPVLAPAAGTVVTVVDGLPDKMPGPPSDPINPAGNHVVLEVADGEYLFIAHMQPGSLTVSEGDAVESGQQIGLTGNSGNTSEPHVHIHLQDIPEFSQSATGLPLVFTDYVANGVAAARDQPLADQFVVTG